MSFGAQTYGELPFSSDVEVTSTSTIALSTARFSFLQKATQPSLLTSFSYAVLDWATQTTQPAVQVGLSAPTLNQDGATHNTSVITNTVGAQLSWSAKTLTFFQATLHQLTAATLRFTAYAIEASGAIAAEIPKRYYTLRRFLGRR